MKNITSSIIFLGSLLFGIVIHSQTKNDSIKVQPIDSISSKKEEKNRNVMLNADNNTGPRQVNIGLPFDGDVIILENDVPVVYTFNPTIPTATWRMSNSLAKLGLLSFAEGALVFGKVGFAVQSSDREPGSTFKGFATIYGNSFGSSRYDLTVSGPLGKKGWGYMVNLFQNFDRGNGVNFQYTPWADRTQMVKAGISKKYNKGNFRVLYKFSDSEMQISNYVPLRFKGNGNTEALNNFNPGKDSYLPGDGLVPYYDPMDGSTHYSDLGQDNKLTAHTFYITGAHRFDSGWKLNYSSSYQNMKGGIAAAVPISLLSLDPDQQVGQVYTQVGSTIPYSGSVQYTASFGVRDVISNTLMSRMELTRDFKKHSLRFGFTQQYSQRKFTNYFGLFLQSIEANPIRLDMYADVPGAGLIKVTNDFGLMPASNGGYGFTTDEKISKVALYASDDIKVNRWLEVGLGARLEQMNIRENKDPYINDFILGRPLIDYTFKPLYNKVGIANAVVKLTSQFGLLGDITYNSYYERYWDYQFRDANNNPIPDPSTPSAKPLQNTPRTVNNTVLNFGGGIFYNLGSNLSIVSKLTSISKTNIRANPTITNPADPNERRYFDPLFYDIRTFGWSTDVVATLFKGFNLHYLLTIQNPQYKNYEFGAFGVNYSYTDKIIPELSKTLMEIDPSYSFMQGALRAWVSLRYYGKQYSNPTNVFFYKGWWENFGGIDYRISRNLDLKLQVINFLDQKGVKGMIQGADLITDATPYINRILSANSIRPRTIEVTINYKF